MSGISITFALIVGAFADRCAAQCHRIEHHDGGWLPVALFIAPLHWHF